MRNLVINHTYEARWKNGNTQYTITKPIVFTITLGEDPRFDLNRILSNVATFTEDEIDNIDTIYEKQLHDFIKKIIDTKPLFGFPNLFYSDRYIEKDLKSLLEHSDNLMLIQAIDRLRKNHPWKANSESSFNTRLEEHTQGITDFALNISQNAAFQNNMNKLYLSIALDSKIEKSHWLFKRETYAYLSSILLKTPIALLELAFVFLTLLTMVMFFMTPLFIAIDLPGFLVPIRSRELSPIC